MSSSSVASAATTPAGMINVKSFAAIGNNVADDTAAIQAAANAAAALGEPLYFPAGTYDVSTALAMPSNATWTAAPGTATLLATAANPLITAVLTQNDTISGLTLAGTVSTATMPGALLIGYRASGITLDNDTIQNTSGIGALFSDVNDTVVENSTFANVGENAASLAHGTQGVAFTTDLPGYGNNNIVSGNSFTAIGLDAISATGQSGFVATGNTISVGPIAPGWLQLPAAAAGVYGDQDNGLVVADNVISGASGNGIDIANSNTVSVYQNTVSGSGGAGIGVFSDTDATVSWNTVTGNDVMGYYQTTGGIIIGAQNAADVVVAHNLSGNTASAQTQAYGIQVLDGQNSAGVLTIGQDNALSANLDGAITGLPAGAALVSDSALPTITYPVGVNDPPVLSLGAGVSTTGRSAVAPFKAAMISAADMGVGETLSVSVSGGDSLGRLSGAGITETATPGVYAIGAPGLTPAAAAAALAGAVFTPAAAPAPPGSVVSATLTVTDVQSSPTSSTTVSARAATTVTLSVLAPISVTPPAATVTTSDEAAVHPFAGVGISDPNAGQSETALVSLSTLANGTLSDPQQASDGGSFSAGVYRVSGSAAAVAGALAGLVFTPLTHEVAPGQTVTTGIDAEITDSAGAAAAIGSTVVATASGVVYGSSNVISAYGTGNMITVGGGSDTIYAGQGLATVAAGNGNDSISLGGGGNSVTGGNGKDTITGAPGGASTLVLGNGNDSVSLGGSLDRVTLGNGADMISLGGGMAFITTGTGNDSITLSGAGSTVVSGGGTAIIAGGSGGNCFVLPASGHGLDVISGFSESNADVLDLRAALLTAGWNQQAGTLGHYVQVSDFGASTLIWLTTAGGGSAVVAELAGAGALGLSDLLAHHALLTT